MNTRTRLPVTGLAAVRNARTRIYAAGVDPKFRPTLRTSTFRLLPAFPDVRAGQNETSKLWKSDVLDRLQAPLTRYRE